MDMSERQYISYEQGEYDKDERLVKKYKRRLEQVLLLEKLPPVTQEGNVNRRFEDMQKEIDELRKIVMKIVNKVGID